MPPLLCPGTLVARLTLIGVFLFPACPCMPAVCSDTCQLPERCCCSTSCIPGLLAVHRGLSRSCRLLARLWSWCEINWHNLDLRRWCQKEEQKTCEIAKNRYDVKLSVGILQLERFDFSFAAWLLCLAAIQASIYSFWETCGCLNRSVGFFSQERFTAVWKDNRFFMLLCRLIWRQGNHATFVKATVTCAGFGKGEKRRS